MSLAAASSVTHLPLPTLLRLSLGGWSFFIAENTLLSHNRTWIIEDVFKGNEKNYHYAYGATSTAATAMIVHGYVSLRGAAPLLKQAGSPQLKAAAFFFQAVGLAGLSQMAPALQIPVESKASQSAEKVTGVATPAAPAVWQVRCPFDFKTSDHDAVTGAGRVSRHSSLWSFASFGLGTAFAVSSIPQAVCLAGPVAVAAIGGAHQDYRFRRGMGGNLPPDLDSRTSNVPFAAMLTGGQGDVAEAFKSLGSEVKEINATVAVLAAVGLAVRRGRR